MGGFGSGRYLRRVTKKPCLDLMRSLDFNGLKDSGAIALMMPIYTFKGIPYELHWQKATLGGYRGFFKCPKCDRRCSKIYRHLKPLFTCRKCVAGVSPIGGANYRSSQVSHLGYQELQAAALKLSKTMQDPVWFCRFCESQTFGLALPPRKPKFMHQTTYNRHWKKFQIKARGYQYETAHYALELIEKYSSGI